jgi:Uma2 family endonuclease
MTMIDIRQLDIPAGQQLLLHNISWQEFKAILENLGERRPAKITYFNGTLEISMPLPENKVQKELIGDMVKISLEELEVDCECFGSTTFKEQSKAVGVEPDQSFYIQNHQLMRGKLEINLTIDPPPDLVIEIDLTSKNQFLVYQALQVPEVWIYKNKALQINVLQEGKYLESETSLAFPGLAIAPLIVEFVEQSIVLGRSPALRAFRQQVRKQIK